MNYHINRHTEKQREKSYDDDENNTAFASILYFDRQIPQLRQPIDVKLCRVWEVCSVL